MPHYDKRRGDLIIRVVYDGAPEAGKTTNVQKLSEMLSLQRRGELASPGTIGRRTEFFDWMDFAGGYLDGHRLRCQIVTVPGQATLLRRRRYLLETADAVIFVADSHPLLVEENRDAFALLEGALARASDAPVSIVLQANKQDRPNALPAAELARRMGVGARTPALASRADQGDGVKEAFLLAVRLAADRVRALARCGAIGFAAPEVGESSETLYDLMVARELREEARGAEPPERDVPTTATPIDEVEEPVSGSVTATASERPSAPAHGFASTPAESIGAVALVIAPEPMPTPPSASAEPPEAAAAPASLPAEAEASAPASTPAPDPVVVPAPASIPAPAPAPARALPLPDPSLTPAGCVWPPMTGRALCASVHGATATVVEGRRAWAPSDAVELRTDRALLLHTRPAWSWPSLETARVALLAEIRALLPMRDVLPEDRAVVLGSDGDEWRLWVITPDLPTLADDLHDALERGGGGDPALVDRCLEAWRALRAKLGPHAAKLHPASVAKTRAGWVLVAFGDGLDRPAGRLFSAAQPPPRALAQRLEETGAWPSVRAEISAELVAVGSSGSA